MVKETISNKVTVHWSFMERVKILLGGVCLVDSEIRVMARANLSEDVDVVDIIVEGSSTKSRAMWPEWVQKVARWFKGRQGYAEQSPVAPGGAVGLVLCSPQRNKIKATISQADFDELTKIAETSGEEVKYLIEKIIKYVSRGSVVARKDGRIEIPFNEEIKWVTRSNFIFLFFSEEGSLVGAALPTKPAMTHDDRCRLADYLGITGWDHYAIYFPERDFVYNKDRPDLAGYGMKRKEIDDLPLWHLYTLDGKMEKEYEKKYIEALAGNFSYLRNVLTLIPETKEGWLRPDEILPHVCQYCGLLITEDDENCLENPKNKNK